MLKLEDFINAGYRRDTVPGFDEYWAESFTQKCVYHSKKAYYINVFFNKALVVGMKSRPTVKLQFQIPLGTMNIDLFSFEDDATIQKVEEYIDHLWRNTFAKFV